MSDELRRAGPVFILFTNLEKIYERAERSRGAYGQRRRNQSKGQFFTVARGSW